MSFAEGFPAQSGVTDRLLDLPHPDFDPARRRVALVVDGETVRIPYRFYAVMPDLRDMIDGRTGLQRVATLCLGARHHDGFVREACVRALIGVREPWVVPYLVMPAGEYVIEIIELLLRSTSLLDERAVARFVRENRPFMETTRRRAISYWDCYFRTAHPRLDACPNILLLGYFERWACP